MSMRKVDIQPTRNKNRLRQALHFDHHEPLTPWPHLLRAGGFRYQYIAKDVLVKNALDEAGIEVGSRVLDVGCGVGVWLDRLGSCYGTQGTGVDVSMRSLRGAELASTNVHQLVMADAQALPFKECSFDLVVSLDTLEHIQDHEAVLNEMIRVVAPGKYMLLYAVSKKNAYTLQWLERKLWALLGVDLHRLACHDPELFVVPKKIMQILQARSAGIKTVRHFHAFFTSIFDRSLLLGYKVSKELGLFNSNGAFRTWLGSVVLGVTTVLCRLAITPLLMLDGPWLRRGFSNGFLAVAVKGNGDE